MPSLLYIAKKEEQFRMDARMLAGFVGPEEVLVKPSIALETRRRPNIASLPRGFKNCGLELAPGLDFEVIKIKCDSQLVVNQVYGIFDTKEERMQQYVVKVQAFLARFREWSITHIPREDNAELDALANLGSSTEIKGPESGTVVQLISSVLDTGGYSEVNSVSLVWDWRNKIINYLEHGKLSDDPKASRALRTKAARYSFRKGQLYRKSFQGPLAQCLRASEAYYVIRETHEGICDNHSGAESLVLKLVRTGYYWPRMEQDAKDFV
ncbi:uncharacterized protein [Nicotiana tomentosiformis]|uniref:uncharacterized protein n=1 Tax=Nicotiana tomentosiformis TaxID=4098 RepID=UPI00388CD9C8